jgi:hypothetical protein
VTNLLANCGLSESGADFGTSSPETTVVSWVYVISAKPVAVGGAVLLANPSVDLVAILRLERQDARLFPSDKILRGPEEGHVDFGRSCGELVVGLASESRESRPSPRRRCRIALLEILRHPLTRCGGPSTVGHPRVLDLRLCAQRIRTLRLHHEGQRRMLPARP